MNGEEWTNQHTFHEILELPFCCAHTNLSLVHFMAIIPHTHTQKRPFEGNSWLKSNNLCSIPYSFSNDLILASLRQINCQYLWMSLEEKILNKYLVYRRVSDNKISPYLWFWFTLTRRTHTHTCSWNVEQFVLRWAEFFPWICIFIDCSIVSYKLLWRRKKYLFFTLPTIQM